MVQPFTLAHACVHFFSALPACNLLFFSWHSLLCVLSMMDLNQLVCSSLQLYLETYCLHAVFLHEMNPIHTVIFHRSYFLAFLSCLELSSCSTSFLCHKLVLPDEEGGRVISHTLKVLVVLPFLHVGKVLLFLQQQDLIADAATPDPARATTLLPPIVTEPLASLLHMIISVKFAPDCTYI